MDREESSFASTTTLTNSSTIPPGPSGLPVVGSMLDYKGPATNVRWAEQYGPIYQVKMGDKQIVYLNTIELVEKYMEGKSGEQFLNRPMGPAAFGQGLLFGNGELWKKNKRAFMKAMHTSTLEADMQSAIHTELDLIMASLVKMAAKGKPFRIGDVLLPACANVVSGFLLGGSLPQASPERESLHRIVRNLEGVDLSSKATQITMKYPKMREPLKRILFRDIVDVHATSRRLQRLIRQWIRQTKSGEIYAKHDESDYTTSPKKSRCPCVPAAPQDSQTDAPEEKRGKKLSLSLPNPAAPSNGEKIRIQVQTTHDTEDITDGPRRRLSRQQEVEHIEEDDESNGSQEVDFLEPGDKTGNLTNIFVSTESLFTVPEDEERAEEMMRRASNLASLGFSSIAPGEKPLEAMEPSTRVDTPDCPRTPLTEFQWQFQREMSINEQHDSILKRILRQPEFAGITEDNDAELLQSLVDMFFGGVTSTLSGLEFVLMYLSKNPTFQMLAQQEISRVLAECGAAEGDNSDVRITWSMRERMPYVRACIVEALRLGGVTPSSLPHIASVDTEIEDFIISKDTFVVASIYCLQRDPKHYIDPLDFRPQRHIECSGDFQVPRSYRPYGVGARSCVGERLAEMELFIFTASILKDFNIVSANPGKKASALETHMRIVHRLKDFKVVLQKRK